MRSALLDLTFVVSAEGAGKSVPDPFSGKFASTVKMPGGDPGRIPHSALPRKPSKIIVLTTVPQTDTGGLVEYTKANG